MSEPHRGQGDGGAPGERPGERAVAAPVVTRPGAEAERGERSGMAFHLLDTMAGGAQVLGPDWRYLYINDAGVQQSGYLCREELLGFSIMDRYPGVENTELFQILHRSMFHRAVQRLETPFVFPGGRAGWFDIAIHPVPEGIFILSYDITSRRQVEERLRNLTALYEVLSTNSSDGIALFNGQSQILYVSPSYARMMGYSVADLQDWNIKKILLMIHPQDRRRISAMLRADQRALRPRTRYEYRARRRNGSYFWVEDFLSREFDQAGNVVRVIANARDIDARKRAEEALCLDGQMMAHMADGVYLARCRDGIIVHSNAQLGQLFGYAAEELIGQHFSCITPSDKRSILETSQELAASLETTGKWIGESENRRRDGSPLWSQTSISIFEHSEHGTVWIAVLQDITTRKQAEAQRRIQEQQAIEDQRLKSLGLLAGGVAHDVNNLLTPISANIELLRNRHSDSNIDQDLLESVSSAGQKIRDIVRQMLAYAGRGSLAFTTVDLNHLVREIYTLIQVSLPKNIVLHLSLSPEPLPLTADSTQLQQVMMNLILNAAEAFAGDSGQVFVQTQRLAPDSAGSAGFALLTVRDTGPGIPPELLPRIFDPFFTTKLTGRGLGLSATHGIVRAHGGTIAVQSRRGTGTTFTVQLPLPTEAGPPQASSGHLAARTPGQLGGLWLVIDDEPMVRKATSLVLQAHGARVIEAGDGTAGLARAEEHAAALSGVLLDLTMPDLSGRQVFQRLRARHPTVPVVLMSGHSEQTVEDLLTLPGVRFVAKPYLPKQLLQLLLTLLGPTAKP